MKLVMDNGVFNGLPMGIYNYFLFPTVYKNKNKNKNKDDFILSAPITIEKN